MAVSTAYINQILPKDAARVSIPGHVIQVVNSQNTNQVIINSDGAIDIGISASITIQQGSSILIQSTVPVYTAGYNGSWQGTMIYVYEGSTWIAQSEHVGTITYEAQSYQIPLNVMIPSRSAGTYTFSLKAARVIGGDRYIKRDNRVANITLMEIAQ